MKTFIFDCNAKEGQWTVDGGTIVVNADTESEARQMIEGEAKEEDTTLKHLDIDNAVVTIVNDEPKGIVHTEYVWMD
jgi:predicted amidohydrolase